MSFSNFHKQQAAVGEIQIWLRV